MKIKLARTVARLVIASTTVLSSATILPVLFVVNVATLATLLVIVMKELKAVIGAMVPPDPLLVVLAKVMLWIVKWRYAIQEPTSRVFTDRVQAFMEELGEGPSTANAPRRIEAGPGGYNQGPSNNDAKPWQRGPTGASAPWGNRGGRDGGYDARDHAPTGPSGGGAAPWARRDGGQNNQDYYGGHHGGHGGYDAPQSNAGAPWQRGHGDDGGGHQAGGYNMYAPGYGGYGQAMGAPPGLGGAPGAPPGAPPGLSNMGAQYGGSPPPPPPSNGAPPPPPPGSAPPPPPPSDRPPPPPPPGA